MVEALAIDIFKEKGDCSIYFWAPNKEIKLFKKHFYPVNFHIFDGGYFFAEDLINLEHYDKRNKKAEVYYPGGVSGYQYSSFLEYQGDLFLLYNLGITGNNSYLLQLTRNKKPGGLYFNPEISLNDHTMDAIFDSNNNLYSSQRDDTIEKKMIQFDDGTLKCFENKQVFTRESYSKLFQFNDIIYDYSKESIFSTNRNWCIFKSESELISMGGVEKLLCTDTEGKVWDVLNKKVIFDNKQPSVLSSFNNKEIIFDSLEIKTLDGEPIFNVQDAGLGKAIVSVKPISAEWLFD